MISIDMAMVIYRERLRQANQARLARTLPVNSPSHHYRFTFREMVGRMKKNLTVVRPTEPPGAT